MSYKPGQVPESDMWSAELAHRLRGEEKTGGSCSAAGRRSVSFYFCCSVLHKQLLSGAGLDYWFRSKKGRTRYGFKVEGADVTVFQMWSSCGSLGILALDFYCMFFVRQEEELKRQKREERLEMIRQNVQLKYAMKRKVSDVAQKSLTNSPQHSSPTHEVSLFVSVELWRWWGIQVAPTQ